MIAGKRRDAEGTQHINLGKESRVTGGTRAANQNTETDWKVGK